LTQKNYIRSYSVAPVVGRSGGLLRAESVLVAALVLEMEMLGPEACLRMMAVETNAAHLMSLETSSTAEEACGRLQSTAVERRVAAGGVLPSDPIHTVAARTLVSDVMLATKSMAEEACGFLQPLDRFPLSTTLVSHWMYVEVVAASLATESSFVTGFLGMPLSDRFRTWCWL
jgi:hypothetical protein